MLEKEWDFYETHRDELVAEYCGKFVVISGDKVVAAYDNDDAAYEETVKTIPLGHFMIHHITDPEEVVYIYPMVSLGST
jgi:hypothetical protein